MHEVLVVDDDPTIRDLLCEVLKDEGYDTAGAVNGQDALDHIRERVPSAVVLDLMMPVMDGWQFLEACRAQPSCANLPILVVSAAHNLKGDRLHQRAQAFLAKPFDVEELVSIVRGFVTGSTASNS